MASLKRRPRALTLEQRMKLLSPMAKQSRVEMYSFSLYAQPSDELRPAPFEVDSKPQVSMSLTRATTNVQYRGWAEITQIEFRYSAESIRPILNEPIDAYQISFAYAKELEAAFMREHGLSTFEELTAFCDRHNIAPADPTDIVRGITLAGGRDVGDDKATVVRVTGKYLQQFPPQFGLVFMMMGYAKAQ